MLTREAVFMSPNEIKLLSVIRESKDPAAMLAIAMDAITACLRQPAPYESPSPVVQESDVEKY